MKSFTETLIRYKQLADYCAPEYGRDNEALTDFKSKYPSLTIDQTHELQCLLTGGDEYTKIFVADLLYLYNDFDENLLEPMITTAIRYHDPSFNRIFVKPCIRRFGYPKVLTLIKSKLISGDIVDRIGVANIFYHLRPGELPEMTELIEEIKMKSQDSDNLIELYFYKLCIRDIDKIGDIPNDAAALLKRIKGNSEWENLLFNKLGWKVS